MAAKKGKKTNGWEEILLRAGTEEERGSSENYFVCKNGNDFAVAISTNTGMCCKRCFKVMNPGPFEKHRDKCLNMSDTELEKLIDGKRVSATFWKNLQGNAKIGGEHNRIKVHVVQR